MRGIPTTMVIGERWSVQGPLPGAMSAHIMLGQDVHDGSQVIVKTMPESAATNPKARQNFLDIAKNWAALKHARLVEVLDVDDGERPVVVMRFVEGVSLQDMIARHGRLPVAVVMDLALQVLDALEHLHRNGVVHGQLVSSDVILSRDPADGLPHVTLTGLANASHTTSGAPSSRRAGPRTAAGLSSALRALKHAAAVPDAGALGDIQALGVILSHMLTGPESLTVAGDAPIGREIPAAIKEVISSMTTARSVKAFKTVDQVRKALIQASEDRAWTRMNKVAAGAFLRGSRPDHPFARDEEFPMETISLDGFFIDRTPVSAAQYKEFLDASGQQPAPGWDEHNDPINAPTRPVVFVNWDEAMAYARWAGKRLPTEAEWEKAARGTDGRIYPWGNNPPTADHACFGGVGEPVDIGSHIAGASPYGVLDMAGNVFEWVEDWFDRHYYKTCSATNPKGPPSGLKRVLRGGSFVHDEFTLRCATRGRYEPEERRANHSFRCVWSL